jgi:transposase
LVAKGYRPVDRDQGFLLPPDMRDWLTPGHRVWFVLDVVRELDTSAFHARSRRGSVGRQGYDPDMLLGVLTYAYMQGVLSSRAIEQACLTDIGYRVLCAQDAPDHTTLARFRKNHDEALADLFGQVLLLCTKAGMGSFGTVAIDGTKIAANASTGANRQQSWLRDKARELLDQAKRVDEEEDALFGVDRSGTEVDEQWRAGEGRAVKIREALQEITEQAERRDAAARAPRVENAKRRVKRAEERIEKTRNELTAKAAAAVLAGRKTGAPIEEHHCMRRAQQMLVAARDNLAAAEVSGLPPSAVREPVGNLTDPQSRKLRGAHGFLQGYNAQLAVCGDGLILAADLCQASPDVEQFVPMMRAAEAAAAMISEATGVERRIGTLLADAGYVSEANITAPGPDRLIATGDSRDLDKHAETAGPTSRSPQDISVLGKMAIKVAANAELYARRGATVEPVNAHIKDRRGLRRFSRRGLAPARSELIMAAWVTNLAKLHKQLNPLSA